MEGIQKQIGKLQISNMKYPLILYNPETLLHKSSRKHPQCPQRISQTISYLQSIQLPPNIIIMQHKTVDKQATQKQIDQTLGKTYHQFFKQMWYEGITKNQLFINSDTYFMKFTYDAALAACDTLLRGIDLLFDNKNEFSSVLALIRPPGHHCGMKPTPHGFSFINNVAVGVNYALKKLKKNKIAIVDWDVHHGEGTQKIFYENQNVLFISIHRYDKATYFPHIKESSSQNIGYKDGQGFNVNVCWDLPVKSKNQTFKPQQTCGDRQYAMCFKQIVMPILKQFQPEMIFVSCGFDSAEGDQIGNLKITSAGYAYMTEQLLILNKKIVIVLEGGYNLQVLKWGVQTVALCLGGSDIQKINQKINQLNLVTQCNQIGKKGIEECLKNIKKYWKNIK